LNAQNPKPDTVMAAMRILKAKRPKYFTHYTLLPHSQSLHGSDWKHPRALVYGGNAQMVLTFNGHPNQRPYEDLEVMCFNSTDAMFEFREITFPKESKENLDYLPPEQRKLPFVISPANGYADTIHDCRQCHGAPLRPNWETYAMWPAAYGAIDDDLFK